MDDTKADLEAKMAELKAKLSTVSEEDGEDKTAEDSNPVEEEEEVKAVKDEISDEDNAEEERELSKEEQALVNKELAKMKANMDRMAKKLRDSENAAAKAEAEQKAASIERLKEEGKLQEALEMELDQIKHKLKVAEAENTTLTRDNMLDTVMSVLDFRNSRSRSMAKQDLTNQLIQVDGAWQHKSGASIADAVEAYAADTENKFLFKSKPNSGAGTQTNATSKPDTNPQPTSILDMTTEQLLKAAASGKFGKPHSF